jgi:signal transduction histidine kinase
LIYNKANTMQPSTSRQDTRFANPFLKVWHILAFLMLAIGLSFCLLDGGVALNQKLLALPLSAGYGLWYWLFIIKRPRFCWNKGAMVASFIAAIAISVALSWIHPSFLMLVFSFYGVTFGALTLRWATGLVVMLSIALAWRFSGFTGGLNASSLPVFVSFLLSAFFTVMLGLYIDSIIRQTREKQKVIDELEETRSDLAKAERQAGMLEERQRLAGEIHDNLAQGFTSIVMYLEAAEKAMDSDPGAVHKYILQARQAARQHLSEARGVLWALRPDVVAREPLSQALQRVVQRWCEESSLPAHLEVTGSEHALPAAIETTFIKAAQEALANVRKHAHASQVNLTLSYMDDEAVLDVQDNGTGFDPGAAAGGAELQNGYGLVALRERVTQLGGRLEVESAPGEGATVVISLPMLNAGPDPTDGR